MNPWWASTRWPWGGCAPAGGSTSALGSSGAWLKLRDRAAPVDAGDVVAAQLEGPDDTVVLTLHNPLFDVLERARRDLPGSLVNREVLGHVRSKQQGVGSGEPMAGGFVGAVHPVARPDPVRHGSAPLVAHEVLVAVAIAVLGLEVHELAKLEPVIPEHVDANRAPRDLEVVLEPHAPPCAADTVEPQ
jgi:hypothetical protein